MEKHTFDPSREEVLSASRRYFEAQNKTKKFIAGETYIPVTVKVVDASDLEYLVDASLDMWLTAGRYARELESILPEKMGQRSKALLVNSGSSANLVAVSALTSPTLKNFQMKPLEPGDEVITVAAGFPTTVNPLFQNNLVPVFIDIDKKTLGVELKDVQAAKTSKTRAIIFAHALGNPYRADLFRQWCDQEGLYFVEDCCDALGSTINGKKAGSFGDYSTLSFYPAHHITMGEGGAVFSRNPQFRRAAESMRDWGRDCWCEPGADNTCGKRFSWKLGSLPEGYDHKYTYSNIGYNLKITDMQAALGLSQLNKVDSFIQARKENWKKLYDGVKSDSLLSDHLTPVEPTEGTDPSWFGFPMHCENGINREKLVQFLEEHKVGTRLFFASNLTRQPAYQNAHFRVHGDLKNSDEVMAHTFWIGVHPALDNEKISYMLEQLRAGIKAQR